MNIIEKIRGAFYFLFKRATDIKTDGYLSNSEIQLEAGKEYRLAIENRFGLQTLYNLSGKRPPFDIDNIRINHIQFSDDTVYIWIRVLPWPSPL